MTRKPRQTVRKLRLDNLEPREQPGSVAGGLVMGLFGGALAEPWEAMASAVGEKSLLTAQPLAELPDAPAAKHDAPLPDRKPFTSATEQSSVDTRSAAPTDFEPVPVRLSTAAYDFPELDLSRYAVPVTKPSETAPSTGSTPTTPIRAAEPATSPTPVVMPTQPDNSANQVVPTPVVEREGATQDNPREEFRKVPENPVNGSSPAKLTSRDVTPPPATAVLTTAFRQRVRIEAIDPDSSQAGGVGGFRVWRRGTDGDLAVSYRVGGTAAASVAYQPLSGRVVIPAGNRFAVIALAPTATEIQTGGAEVELTLVAGKGYRLEGRRSATTRVTSFAGRPTVSVAAGSATVGETSPYGAFFTFTRTTTVGPLTVSYAMGGTAEAGTDYERLTGSVSFPAGSDRATVWLQPVADGHEEGRESATLELLTGAGYDIGPGSSATVTMTDDGEGELPPGFNGSGTAGQSSHPVRYKDGLVIFESTDLVSAGFGQPWAYVRKWMNHSVYHTNDANGNGWVNASQPYLLYDPATIGGAVGVVVNGDESTWFNWNGTAWTPQSTTTLQLASASGELVVLDATGNEYRFADFSSSHDGQLKKFTDAYGNVTEVVSWHSDSKPAEIRRSATVGGSTVTEAYVYTYIASGTNAGKLQSIKLTRGTGSSPWPTVREVAYSYYGSAEYHGNEGDLKFAVTKDAAGNPLNTEYFRYWDSDGYGGVVGGMKYAVRGDSYALLKAWADANSTTPEAATDSVVQDYADHYFEYDANRRVSKETAKGAGNAGDLGGQGTFTFSYSSNGMAMGVNDWRIRTIETLPDGDENHVYTNPNGAVLLSAFLDNTTADKWITYNRYLTDGRMDWTANPSAVLDYSDSYSDLLNFQFGASAYLADSAGLIESVSYYSSTTATSSTPGGVDKYVESAAVRHGELGTAVPQSTLEYLSRRSGGKTIYVPAVSTQYRTDNGTGDQDTVFGYTWPTTGFGPTGTSVTYPTVSTGQNGSNSALTRHTGFDALGYPAWSKDVTGHLWYTAWDVPTGAVAKLIDDVDSTATSDFTGLPSGWSTPAGGGQHRITLTESDALGRPTKTTRPGGDLTYVTYDDPNQSMRVYAGWNTSTNLPAVPTTVFRTDRAKGYVESITMTATPAVSSGRPTGTESVSGLQTLARDHSNTGGQKTASDTFFDLTGLTYSTSVSLGTEGTNFNRMDFGYDSRGRQDRAESATGTVYRTVYDGQHRLLSEWVGTDDAPTSGVWSPANTTGTNLTKTREYEYDGGDVGDGLLTGETAFPGNGSPDRADDYFYDWRGRLVAAKYGAQSSENTAVNRPIDYYDLDNLGQVTKVRTFDGDGVTVTSSSGVPQAPSSSLLRARTDYAYDELGETYKAEVYSVDPSSGSVSSTALTTQTWRDGLGNPVKITYPGGLVWKGEWDGLGYLTTEYSTDAGGDSSYADALTVTGDAVLEQTEYDRDANGNLVQTTTRQRFHDETATGALGTPGSGVKARVSHVGYFHDVVDRVTAVVDVGTNGGSSWTRPGSVPSRSDSVLVTSYDYDTSGLLEQETDPLGIVTRYGYDDAGRFTSRVDHYTNGTVTDDSNRTVAYAYNGNDQPVSMTVSLPGGGQQTTAWVYGVTVAGGSGFHSNDALGEVRFPDPSTGAASSSEKYTYKVNALGEEVSATDRNGTVKEYTFDALGRLTADKVSTLASGVDGSVRRIELGYDGLGNAALFTSYDAASGGNIVNQVQRDFNGLGQMTSEWQEHDGAVDGSTLRVQYDYTEMASSANHSRLEAVVYPNGKSLAHNYASGLDANISRLSSLSDTSGTLESYDHLGLNTAVRLAHPLTGVDLTYVRLSGESDGAAGDKYTGLDAFGRIVDQRWTTSGGTAKDRLQYGYDRDGRRLYRENVLSTTRSELYEYDGLGQLTDFARGDLDTGMDAIQGTPQRTLAWDHDALGNFDSVTTNGTAQTRTHNKQNEMTAVGGATPAYDAEGNLTTGPDGRQYVYDAWNMLVAVKNSGGTTIASHEYDGTGRRIVVDEGGVERDLYYSDSWQVLEERVGGTARTQYVWSPTYVDAMVLRDRDTDANGSLDERRWPLYDANFNVTALVNNSGTVVERYEYDPFGAATALDAGWLNPGASGQAWTHLYQGLATSPVTGLVHARHRDLDVASGRPLTRDPIGYAAGDANVYRWVGNDATNLTDPTGLDPLDVIEIKKSLPSHAEMLHEARLAALAEQRKAERGFWSDLRDSITGPLDPGESGFFEGFIPVWSDLRDALHEGANGNDGLACLYILSASVDIATFGGWSLIKAPLKAAAKAGAKGAAKEVVMEGGEKFVKDGAERIAKGGADKVSDGGKYAGKDKRPCFLAGTPIRTAEGSVPIESLRPGMMVLSRPEYDADGIVEGRTVEAVFVRRSETIDVYVEGRAIRSSMDHPFWVHGKGWIGAQFLEPGDEVRTSGTSWRKVEEVRPTGLVEEVYNFRVAEWHTYFVGDPQWGFDVWVHNSHADAGNDADSLAREHSRVGEMMIKFKKTHLANTREELARETDPHERMKLQRLIDKINDELDQLAIRFPGKPPS